MAPGQQIQLNQLLLDREAAFARIHALEQEVGRVLGGPYPFARPALPSDQRRKTKSAARSAFTARDSLRRLDEDEKCFRVIYRQGGREFIEEHDDLTALRSLCAAQGTRLVVLRLETLGADGSVKALLHDSAAAPASANRG